MFIAPNEIPSFPMRQTILKVWLKKISILWAYSPVSSNLAEKIHIASIRNSRYLPNFLRRLCFRAMLQGIYPNKFHMAKHIWYSTVAPSFGSWVILALKIVFEKSSYRRGSSSVLSGHFSPVFSVAQGIKKQLLVTNNLKS